MAADKVHVFVTGAMNSHFFVTDRSALNLGNKVNVLY